jgi:hypothetical protein
MAQKAYIIIEHVYRPAPGVNTSVKGWADADKSQQMIETIYFVTRIRKRWWQTATTILNVTDSKVEKNTAETRDFHAIMNHVKMKYPDKFGQFMSECVREGLAPTLASK